MNLDEFRNQNPAYADKISWPDDKLSTGLYNKYYKDKMTQAEFNQKLGSTAERPAGYGAPGYQSPVPESKPELIKNAVPTTEEPPEGWQAYADNVSKNIEAEEPVDGMPWVDPVMAGSMTGGLGLKLGKGLAKTAAMVAASLLAEPVTGTGLDYMDRSLEESDMSPFVKIPVTLATGMVAGTLLEGGILKLGQSVKASLNGAKPTVENVAKVLRTFEDTGAEDVISQTVKGPSKPLDMGTAVKEITKRSKVKLKPEADDVEEILPKDVIHVDNTAKATGDIKEVAKSETANRLNSMALGTVAGVDEDEDGNLSYDMKRGLIGAAVGVVAGRQVQKMFTGTRLPGASKAVKREVKLAKQEAKRLKKSGVSEEEIFINTGMRQGPEGLWRQEIDDSNINWNLSKDILDRFAAGDTVKYGEVVQDHPELFKRYPALAELPITRTPKNAGYSGGFRASGTDSTTNLGSMELDYRQTKDEIKSTVLHEGQHAVQYAEGFERGGSPKGLLMRNIDLTSDRDTLVNTVKTMQADPTTPPEMLKTVKKDLKRVKSRLRHLGLSKYSDEITELDTKFQAVQDNANILSLKMADLEKRGLESTKEYKQVYKEWQGTKTQRQRIADTREIAKKELYTQATKRYYAIAGEQEAVMTSDRRQLSSMIRMMSLPRYEPDTLQVSRLSDRPVMKQKLSEPEFSLKQSAEPGTIGDALKINAQTSATTAGMGAIYSGVDWDQFEETGRIVVNPKDALTGLLAGASVGMGISAAPKLASHWTDITKNKILDPLVDVVKGTITNETIRYQLGLGRSEEAVKMVKEYRKQSSLILRKSIALGRELNDAAPGKLQQKRLAQVLEGGITTNPTLAKKAHKINKMFKDLKDATREMNLSHYSRFDNLTRTQRADLRNIIKNVDTPAAEKITAQTILNNHYHIGSSKEYLPIFNPAAEGLTKTEKKAVNSELKNLKKRSRYQNPEGDQVLEVQIAELEDFLHKGTKKIARANGVTLDQGYATMRQDMPAETTRVFNEIVGPAYRAAKGAASQGTDVLKAKLIDQVANNPEWVWPKGGGKAPKNYTSLYGKEWGPLNKRYIRNDVLDDLSEVIDYRSDAERNMDKIMGYWKYGKAILNPVTHARNFVSNMALAHLADVSPLDIATYAAAGNAVKQGRDNIHFKEAEDWGLYNNTFIESDISVLRDELADLRDPGAVATWIRKAASVPSTMYDQSERFFKTAVFIKARESGLSIDSAAKKAEQFLFNYQDIPPVVKHYKRWAAPFVTYTYKATPAIAESVITKPWKAAGLFGAMYGLEELAQKKLSVTDEEVTQDKSVMLDKRGQVLLPFTSDNGDRLYGNVGSFMPWSGMGQTWGQSDIPLGDFLPSNPLFTIGAALVTNKENFTGKEIHDRVLDGTLETTKKYMEYAWKQLVPSLAPGGYSAEKLVTAFKNGVLDREITDYTGQIKDPSTLAIRALLGVKLTPANQELYDRFAGAKIRGIQRAVSKRRIEVLKQLQQDEIGQEEADEQLQALRDLQIEKVMKQINNK